MGVRDLFWNLVARDQTGAAFSSVRKNLLGIDGVALGLSNRLTGIGHGLKRMGIGMSIATAPIALAFRGLIGSAGDFEQSMNRLSAVSGVTGDAFDSMRGQAKTLGTETRFSANEAADGMTFLAMAGFDANQILAATPGVLQLAAAANLELAESADIVSNVLTGYRLSAYEVGRANDVMIATTTGSNTNLLQLGDAFKYVGPVAKAVGLEFELTAAIIGKFGDAGIQGEMAGTSLRGALTRLLNPTREVNSALSGLGISVNDASGALLPFDEILRRLEPHADNAGAMMKIFGQRAGPAMIALLSQGTAGIFEFQEALENAGGTAEDIANKQMEGLRGRLLELNSAWQGLGIAIGDSGVLDTVTAMIEKVTEFTRSLSEANPALLRFGTIIGGFAVVAGPVILTLGALSLALGAISLPVTAVVAGITALGGAMAYFWPEAEKTTSATDTLTLALGDEITQSQILAQRLGTNTAMTVAGGKAALGAARDRYKHVAAIIAENRALAVSSDAYAGLTTKITDQQNVLNSLGFPAIDAATARHADAFEDAQLRLVGLLNERQKLLDSDEASAEQLKLTTENIKALEEALASAEGGVVKFGDSLLTPIVPAERLGGGLKGLKGDINKIPKSLEEATDAFDGFGKETTGLLKDVFSDGKVTMDDFGDFVNSWGASLLDRLLSNVFDPIADGLDGLFDKMLNGGGGSGGGGMLSGLAGGISGGIGNFFSGLFGLDTGGELSVGGRNGIDRNVAAFKVTAGETVKVVKRGGSDGSGPVNVYIQTPDPGAFNASKGQISAQIARAVGRGSRFA